MAAPKTPAFKPWGSFEEKAVVALEGAHNCFLSVEQFSDSLSECDSETPGSIASSASTSDHPSLRGDDPDICTSALWIMCEEKESKQVMFRCADVCEPRERYLRARADGSIDVNGVHGQHLGILWTVVPSSDGERLSFRSVYGTYLNLAPPTQKVNQVMANAIKIDGWERFKLRRISLATDAERSEEWHFYGEKPSSALFPDGVPIRTIDC